jgi:hypothetical protein
VKNASSSSPPLPTSSLRHGPNRVLERGEARGGGPRPTALDLDREALLPLLDHEAHLAITLAPVADVGVGLEQPVDEVRAHSGLDQAPPQLRVVAEVGGGAARHRGDERLQGMGLIRREVAFGENERSSKAEPLPHRRPAHPPVVWRRRAAPSTARDRNPSRPTRAAWQALAAAPRRGLGGSLPSLGTEARPQYSCSARSVRGVLRRAGGEEPPRVGPRLAFARWPRRPRRGSQGERAIGARGHQGPRRSPAAFGPARRRRDREGIVRGVSQAGPGVLTAADLVLEPGS